MKSILSGVLLVLILFGCGQKENKPLPFVPEFVSWKNTAYVSVNGTEILKHYIINVNDSVVGFNFTSSKSDYSLYYVIGGGIRTNKGGTFFMHQWLGQELFPPHLSVETMCCFDTPDQFEAEYLLNEADSLNNFFRLHLNKAVKKVSGYFQATLINEKSPYDTMYLQCDTFSCRYD
ncbi:MAG: hypothetical protein WCI97_09555 [Bacteroidota bacterium]